MEEIIKRTQSEMSDLNDRKTVKIRSEPLGNPGINRTVEINQDVYEEILSSGEAILGDARLIGSTKVVGPNSEEPRTVRLSKDMPHQE